jgi:hypothetical protein
MVRVAAKAFWLFLPTLTNIFIRGTPSEGFESLGEVVRHQEGVEVCFQVLMGLIIVFFNCRFLERSIHALHLAIGPGMVSFGQPMGDCVFLTDACKDVLEGIYPVSDW